MSGDREHSKLLKWILSKTHSTDGSKRLDGIQELDKGMIVSNLSQMQTSDFIREKVLPFSQIYTLYTAGVTSNYQVGNKQNPEAKGHLGDNKIIFSYLKTYTSLTRWKNIQWKKEITGRTSMRTNYHRENYA